MGLGIFKKRPVGLGPDNRRLAEVVPEGYPDWLAGELEQKLEQNAARRKRALEALDMASVSLLAARVAKSETLAYDARGVAIQGPASLEVAKRVSVAGRAQEQAQAEVHASNTEWRDLEISLRRAKAGLGEAVKVIADECDRAGFPILVPADHPGLQEGSHTLQAVRHTFHPELPGRARALAAAEPRTLPPGVSVRTQADVDRGRDERLQRSVYEDLAELEEGAT